jgi:GNAT superfamily N-acetyltransferase
MSRAARLEYEVRPYAQEDEPRVLELLGRSLGGGPLGQRSPEFFRWKHLDNPFGPSFMLVAERDDRIIGLRAFMRWRFRAAGHTFEAVRAVDTATDPDHQGLGVFRRLTTTALAALEGVVDLVFNTPNEKSLPGYLKMGWEPVGRIPVRVRVRNPVRFGRGFRSLRDAEASETTAATAPPKVDAPLASEGLGSPGEVETLLEQVGAPWERLSTPRDVAFLRWRYGSAPGFDYRVVREERDGRLRGLAVFRVRARGALWETTVADVIVGSGDVGTAARLLRRVTRVASVDHVTGHFPDGSEARAAATRSGFVPTPAGVTFVVNPLRSDLLPDPRRLGSWGLCLGDVEVF